VRAQVGVDFVQCVQGRKSVNIRRNLC
jgi:hypothetical protein